MQIKMLAGTALQLARELYAGPSTPLTEINSSEAREALDPEWWSTSEKAEGVDSDRQLGALRLYVAIGKHASHSTQTQPRFLRSSILKIAGS